MEWDDDLNYREPDAEPSDAGRWTLAVIIGLSALAVGLVVLIRSWL